MRNTTEFFDLNCAASCGVCKQLENGEESNEKITVTKLFRHFVPTTTTNSDAICMASWRMAIDNKRVEQPHNRLPG